MLSYFKAIEYGKLNFVGELFNHSTYKHRCSKVYQGYRFGRLSTSRKQSFVRQLQFSIDVEF